MPDITQRLDIPACASAAPEPPDWLAVLAGLEETQTLLEVVLNPDFHLIDMRSQASVLLGIASDLLEKIQGIVDELEAYYTSQR